MQLWFISDTHWGHENMYTFMTADGSHRVRHKFHNAREADAAMVQRWNERVKPHDHVYHLGDVAFDRGVLETIMPKLNGKKRLLLGNHDHFQMDFYRRVGFQKIGVCARFEKILFTHIPVHPYSLDSPKLIANAHGHTHEGGPIARLGDKPYINLSVERTHYAPVALEDIVKMALDKRMASLLL